MSLREKRNEAGLSQSQLAKKSGISIKNIQHYEAKTRDLDKAKLETISRLALALGCKITDLLNSNELKKLYKKVK